MNNLNFNYWLQGYFELMGPQDGTNPYITVAQVKCIRDHIDLVKKAEMLGPFAAWLEGFLDAKGTHIAGFTSLDTQAYIQISNKLNDFFAHMIAPSSKPYTLSQFGGTGTLSLDGISSTVC